MRGCLGIKSLVLGLRVLMNPPPPPLFSAPHARLQKKKAKGKKKKGLATGTPVTQEDRALKKLLAKFKGHAAGIFCFLFFVFLKYIKTVTPNPFYHAIPSTLASLLSSATVRWNETRHLGLKIGVKRP